VVQHGITDRGTPPKTCQILKILRSSKATSPVCHGEAISVSNALTTGH